MQASKPSEPCKVFKPEILYSNIEASQKLHKLTALANQHALKANRSAIYM